MRIQVFTTDSSDQHYNDLPNWNGFFFHKSRVYIPVSVPIDDHAYSEMGYKWQFQDEFGNWIQYGKISSSKNSACKVTTSSEAIERQFAKNPNAIIRITSPTFQYRLDFNTMKQTNLRTQVIRDVRRVAEDRWGAMNYAFEPWFRKYTKVVAPLKLDKKPKLIYQVINTKREDVFKARMAQLQRKNPHVKYEIKELFHGTSSSNAISIAHENIDFARHGPNYICGKGAYFTNDVEMSRRYGDAIFICKVLVGLFIKGNSNISKAPEDNSMDTTVDDINNPTIFVKYDFREFYPVYCLLMED
ncbi:protein mono-ADP-ribosyltransferase PARP11-like [Hyalella azteca]|uniref:Protein mono-ADP-ribosyltransferase PARP11-like n=1 Tax=Hyalella azteca TaxID=294128 RepID=A0A8B7NTB4_HYAAZ|nr:protein mono-ADP-ribosyltransferase PARP11-like [Hyalella azteca]